MAAYPSNFRLFGEQIYAGGEPSADFLDFFKQTLNGKVVVSLDQAIGKKIAPRVKQLGMQHLIIPITMNQKNSDSVRYIINNIVKILSNNQPIYIHCLHGSDRTGFALAIYRIKRYGTKWQDAVKEAQKYGYGLRISLDVQNSWNNLLAGLQGQTTTPAEKTAASQSLMTVKDPHKFWFTGEIANSSLDEKKFGVFDVANIKAIKNFYDYMDKDEARLFYLNNEKTQNLINYIVRSFNKNFPGRDGWGVYTHLLDGDSEIVSSTPIFILIHDLIHSVIQPDFTESLQKQRENDDETILIEEIFEDLASTMSNFQPSDDNGYPGLFFLRYVNKTFENYIKEFSDDLTEEDLKDVIIKTFHEIKFELRSDLSKMILKEKYKNNPTIVKTLSQIKQLFDGILSSYKNQMLQQVIDVILKYENAPQKYNLWNYFDLKIQNDKVRNKMQEADVIEPADSSALRGWMNGCLSEMKKLYDYFQNLTDEFAEENQDELYLDDKVVMQDKFIPDEERYPAFKRTPEDIRGVRPDIEIILPYPNFQVKNYPRTTKVPLDELLDGPETGGGPPANILSII